MIFLPREEWEKEEIQEYQWRKDDLEADHQACLIDYQRRLSDQWEDYNRHLQILDTDHLSVLAEMEE